ncbi:MAG: hypothetical protein K0B07_00150 [DPANN group archaeon]|nr:hypothetical protein [DPANN group archaeon]
MSDTDDKWDSSELGDYMHNLSNMVNFLIKEHLKTYYPPGGLQFSDLSIDLKMEPKPIIQNTYESHQKNISYEQVKLSIYAITEWYNLFTTVLEADDVETIYGMIGFDESSDYSNLEKVVGTDKITTFDMFNYLDPIDVEESKYDGYLSDMFNHSDLKIVVDSDYSEPHKNCICFNLFPQDCSKNILVIYRVDTCDVFVNTRGYTNLNPNYIIDKFF